ncbi:phosphohydrolase [Frischella perrara]|uniref:Phosphohydrolase n=1 Tax=Frischella perrara TaxID=1267021 RepID=A0A318MTL3_FRIPE|nr:HD domain-containing protein [Frischella perrara]PXY96596.1 phosphohydrolase [Frischella perrara]
MLTEQQQQIITNIYDYVCIKLANDTTGHDIAHIERVVKLAKHIQSFEPQTNLFIVIISAYLHDVIDDKVIENYQSARNDLLAFMAQQPITQDEQLAIFSIIDNMSFSKNLTKQRTLSREGQIVQDADRLDAMGAIGIGRAFYYGGNKHNSMYDPNIKPRILKSKADYRQSNTIINHFYEKLLLLKDKINTPEGKRLAEQRHHFLIEFVKRFEIEWEGE